MLLSCHSKSISCLKSLTLVCFLSSFVFFLFFFSFSFFPCTLPGVNFAQTVSIHSL